MAWNLLTMMESETSTATYAIRELNATSRCDAFLGEGIRSVRNAYGKYLEKHGNAGIRDRMDRLETTDQDERMALATQLHYNAWTREQLLSALPLTVRSSLCS